MPQSPGSWLTIFNQCIQARRFSVRITTDSVSDNFFSLEAWSDRVEEVYPLLANVKTNEKFPLSLDHWRDTSFDSSEYISYCATVTFTCMIALRPGARSPCSEPELSLKPKSSATVQVHPPRRYAVQRSIAAVNVSVVIRSKSTPCLGIGYLNRSPGNL